MISLRLKREMGRNILVPIIIDVEYNIESVKEALMEVTSQRAIGALSGLIRSLGAPELLDAYLQRGYVHDIQLPSFRLLSTFSTKEAIGKLNDMPGIRNIHFDMNKAAPPRLPYLPSPLLVGFGILGGERTEGWFGTKDVHGLLGVDVAHEEGYTAENIKIAVIDTGVHRQHRQLLGTRTRATSVLPVARLLERAVGDSSGHGSWCVTCINGREQEVMEGIIVKGLTNAEVLSIRALFTPLGTGKDSDVLKAMSIAYEDGVDIISMSLGGGCEGPGCLTCAAVRDLSAKNVIMCIAAGNEGLPNSVACPGKEPSAITVGSISIMDGSRSYFSSMGPAVDCAVYGGGRAAAEAKPEEYIYSGVSPYSLLDTLIDHRRSGYGLLAGTSMATPMMAAMVALWNDYYYKATSYYLTPVDIHNILLQFGHNHSVEDGYGVAKFDWIKGYV